MADSSITWTLAAFLFSNGRGSPRRRQGRKTLRRSLLVCHSRDRPSTFPATPFHIHHSTSVILHFSSLHSPPITIHLALLATFRLYMPAALPTFCSVPARLPLDFGIPVALRFTPT